MSTPPRARLRPTFRPATLRPVLLFLALLGLADRALGAGLELASARALDGEKSGGLLRAALADRRARWVVFGSSRVRRHVDPVPLEAALGERVRNAGCDGHGVLYARLLAALMRAEGSRARSYVLDLNPHDLVDDRAGRLGLFAPFVGRDPRVDAALEARDPFARLKLLSHVYRYNSAGLPSLARALRGGPPSRGFAPLAPRAGLRPTPPSPVTPPAVPRADDAAARGLAHYAAFVDDARVAGVEVRFLVGPRRGGWPAPEARALATLLELARARRVSVIDLRALPVPNGHWVDDVHLDARGAE
ncbi:MAG TPA: hypothetical protein RMI62_24295, partial [Polyangiaceae bacterium LLY-WYZ-15_(1-7)]|nr:hypothetical protein [Polyangiaceae bacterium LLY-WYZ-15_(1-7)]